MGMNKKLILLGLAAGVTAYMLYKASKKKQAKQQKLQASSGGSGGSSNAWGMAAGAAAIGAAGYGAHSMLASKPPTHDSDGDVTWDALRDWQHIAKLLSQCVLDQHLLGFYPWARVQAIAQGIANSGSLVECAESWEIPPVLASDLVKLALFDVAFLLDDSASMRSEGRLRRDALASILKRAADAAGRFDADGMEVAWMNDPMSRRKIHNGKEAKRLVEESKFDGPCTPMGAALEEKLLRPLLAGAQHGQLNKPLLVLVITDGRPTGHSEKGDRIVKVIKDAKNSVDSTQYGADAVSFSIAAVGNDHEAQEWLDTIDAHPEVGDLVDVCSDFRVEAAQIKKATGITLTEDLHCLKVLLGAIDSSYDASDEPPASGSKYARRANDSAVKVQRWSAMRAMFERERDAALGQGAGAVPLNGMAQAAPAGYGSAPQGYPQQQAAYPQPGYAQQAPSYAAAPPQPGYPSYAPQAPAPQGYPQQAYGFASPPQAAWPAPPGGASPYPPAPGASPYPPAPGGYGAPPPYPADRGMDAMPGGGAGGFAMPQPQHDVQQAPYPPPQPPQGGPAFPSFPSTGNGW